MYPTRSKNVLIVTDQGVMEAGWADVVEKSCKSAELSYTSFNEITTNPKDYEAELVPMFTLRMNAMQLSELVAVVLSM